MQKVQKQVESLHALLVSELGDPELDPVLRALYLGIKKECEALDEALVILGVSAVSDETSEVNEKIQADWANPEKQVSPDEPHVFETALD